MVRLLVRLSLFLPLIAAMAAVNWIVDPARFFARVATAASDGYEGAILKDLLANRPHTVVAEFDQRVVLEELIRSRSEIDVLVLGSSVSKPFHSELFPGRSMVNGAVQGGELEEAICIYELAGKAGGCPSACFWRSGAGVACWASAPPI